MNNNESDLWPERFRKARDVNELLATARQKMQEENGIHLPLEDEDAADDAAMDFAWGVFCNWILLSGSIQIEGQKQVDEVMESFIETLRKMQARFPRDDEELKKEILYGLKRQLIGPNYPLQ